MLKFRSSSRSRVRTAARPDERRSSRRDKAAVRPYTRRTTGTDLGDDFSDEGLKRFAHRPELERPDVVRRRSGTICGRQARVGEVGGVDELVPIVAAAEHEDRCTVGDEIEERLSRQNVRLEHREGRSGAEWMLLDYGAFVVHIFTERARLYYDLERLWRTAERLDIPDNDMPSSGAAGSSDRAASSSSSHDSDLSPS